MPSRQSVDELPRVPRCMPINESSAWNPLHAGFAMQRISHQHGYSVDGAYTNGAESYFSRRRRGQLEHHHHIAGPFLVRYAQEAAWREDRRRARNGDRVHGVARLAIRCRPSVDFRGNGNAPGPLRACQELTARSDRSPGRIV
jgi:hypothetical protein